jgi:diguanylate cyclase (GGDEF)-like protein
MGYDYTSRSARFRSFVMRHRFAMRDLSIVAVFALVTLYWVYEVDVFENAPGLSTKNATIELDEALLVGGLLALALLAFAWRQYVRQRHETARRVAAEQHARELAYQDGLTGLPNRRRFDEALKEAIGSPPRAGACHGLFLLDLNGFKQINDIHGHGVGDEVLTIVGQRLLAAMRDGDMVARIGGDEFAVLAMHLLGSEAATNVAMRVVDALEAPITAGGSVHRIGTGIGIAMIPQDANTGEEAQRKADVALYRAKAERRSAIRFFEPLMDARVHERSAFVHELRAAVAAGDIKPIFLPIVQLASSEVTGFELKPRWEASDGTVVPAERFIPVAEEAGLMHAIGEDLLRKGCEAAAVWPAHVTLAADVFQSQLKDQLFSAKVVRLLHETGVAPSRLQLEITESALVADPESAGLLLGTLRGAGIRVVLDNFGTGYSSLYHLRNFKLDAVKIDRRFVETMNADHDSASIVTALVGLGRGLGMSVIAEGVAASDQESSLLNQGCETGQGPLFSEPLTSMGTAGLFGEAAHRDQMAKD